VSAHASDVDAPRGALAGLATAGRRLAGAPEAVLLLVLVVLGVAISLRNGQFWTSDNLENVALDTSSVVIVAVAATMVLIAGQLDLSVGSVYALGAVVAAEALTHGVPTAPAVALGLATGAACGAINGSLVVGLRVPALIATLGTLYAMRGLVLVITSGAPVYPLPDSFLSLGQGKLAGIPVPVWIAVAVLAAGHLVLRRTVIGRQMHNVGSNESAALLAGVPITRVRMLVFALSGMAAALGGMLVAARISSAQTNSGTGLELTVIAAVIIGGTSLFGGSGSVLGTLLGALLISVIANGLVLAEIDPFYQNIVVGAIIVLAVAVDGWRRRRLAER
jgi:ribose/xylose/arabinose/galactoside ABC-type transport system permease subunit